jgi:hypothetical protein
MPFDVCKTLLNTQVSVLQNFFASSLTVDQNKLECLSVAIFLVSLLFASTEGVYPESGALKTSLFENISLVCKTTFQEPTP